MDEREREKERSEKRREERRERREKELGYIYTYVNIHNVKH